MKNKWKWLMCWICLMGVAAQTNVAAEKKAKSDRNVDNKHADVTEQMVTRKPYMELSSDGVPPYYLTRGLDSDFKFQPMIHFEDSLEVYTLITRVGARKNASKCLKVTRQTNPKGGTSTSSSSSSTTMKTNREIFFQSYDSSTLNSYYIDYTSKAISIGCRRSKFEDFFPNHNDSVYYSLYANGEEDYGFNIIHAVSPNQRYLIYEIYILSYDNEVPELLQIRRLRWDMQEDSLEELEAPIGYATLANMSSPKIVVTNQGDIIELTVQTTKLKGLKEVFVKEHYNFFDYSDTEEYAYLQLNHFPLNSRGTVNNYLLNDSSYFVPKMKLLKDDQVLLYGFSHKGQSVLWNTLKFNLHSQDFETEQHTSVMNRWTATMEYSHIYSLGYLNYSLQTIGLEELDNGGFVAFADWECVVNTKHKAFNEDLTLHINLLHCVLDSNLRVLSGGYHYNEYVSANDRGSYHHYAQAYTATDGKKAMLFVPITKKNSKKKLHRSQSYKVFHNYSNRSFMKVVTVDYDNHYNAMVLQSKDDYTYVLSKPQYDAATQDWLVTLLTTKNTRLERWKIQ